MRLTTSWLLSALVTVASAAQDASVYLIEGDRAGSSNPPTLSPEQARLVIAQRLKVSEYHSLADADAATISHINQFGGQHSAPFSNEEEDTTAEVVLIVDGLSTDVEQMLQKALSTKPEFYISGNPSKAANSKLVEDISKQVGKKQRCATEQFLRTPIHETCLTGSTILYHDLSKSSTVATFAIVDSLQRFQKHYSEAHVVNLLLIINPKNSGSSTSKSVYGSYEMPSQAALHSRQFEESVISDHSSAGSNKPAKVPHSLANSTRPITGIPAVCYSTLDSCTEKTNSCSGHGKCYKKRGTAGKDACFACGCQAQNQTFIHGNPPRTGVRLVYWGGAACQKKDVSAPFWLISIFTIVLVGLVSWAIGLMYSIGEEKLPGVIGAGVSNNKAR